MAADISKGGYMGGALGIHETVEKLGEGTGEKGR